MPSASSGQMALSENIIRLRERGGWTLHQVQAGSNSLFIIVYDCLQYDDIQKLASLRVVLEEEFNYRQKNSLSKISDCYYNVVSGNAFFPNHSNLYHEAAHKLWIPLLAK